MSILVFEQPDLARAYTISRETHNLEVRKGGFFWPRKSLGELRLTAVRKKSRNVLSWMRSTC